MFSHARVSSLVPLSEHEVILMIPSTNRIKDIRKLDQLHTFQNCTLVQEKLYTRSGTSHGTFNTNLVMNFVKTCELLSKVNAFFDQDEKIF